MPIGNKTKKPAFEMWLKGKALGDIQDAMRKRGTLPASVKGWISDWERGRQQTWEPTLFKGLLYPH
jgi:hypothetical protein